MDFAFTEEQQAAVEAARAVFSDIAPDRAPSPALTRGAVAEDIDRQLWNELARTDLLGLTLSPDHGGAGLDPIALCLVLRESAKVLARVPLLESCAVAMAVQRYGGGDLAADLLPRAGRGELILTVGANGRSGHNPAELAVRARPYGQGDGEADAPVEGSGWVLDGVQSAVPWAQAADWIAIPAHTAGGGPVLALVRRTREGVTLAGQVFTSGERLAEVRLDAVRVEARELIDIRRAAGSGCVPCSSREPARSGWASGCSR